MMVPAFIVSLLFPLFALAIVVPVTPDSTGVYDTGASCPIAWDADTTGEWNNFTIWLMTGPNNPMVYLETVVAGLDGTASGTTSFTWPCPDVTINAPIYFYQFQQYGQANLTWTTRFTIASATGATVPAPDAVQPDGTSVPWGPGALVSNSSTSSPAVSSAPAPAVLPSVTASAPSGMVTVSVPTSSPPSGTVIVTVGGSSPSPSSISAPASSSSKNGASIGTQISSVLAALGAVALGVAWML